MLSTLLAAANHSDIDGEALVVCLLIGLLVGVLVFAVLRAVPVAYANLIGLCAGALAFIVCWFD